MKRLEFVTEEVTTNDQDNDPQKSTVTYATVTDDTVGQEIVQRNGESRVLRKGEVVVPATTNTYDVFSVKEWEDTWADTDRVVKAVASNANVATSGSTDQKSSSAKPS